MHNSAPMVPFPSLLRALFMVCAVLVLPAPSTQAEDLTLSTVKLEERIHAIHAELEQLATFTMRNGSGAIGYRSQDHSSPNQSEWIHIDLEKECIIDEIILVPSIWRDANKGVQADCFPEEFHVTAGCEGDEKGTLIASITSTQARLKDISPLIIPVPQVSASWVKITVTQLSRRSFDRLYSVELSEVMVFSGLQNMALLKPVSVSSPIARNKIRKKPEYLVDGFLPYLMDGAGEYSSIALFSPVRPTPPPTITIDLGSIQTINGINLHAVDPSNTIPAAHSEGLAIPKLLRIETATLPDFSDARLSYENIHRNIYDMGPIIRRPLEQSECRYVKLTAVEPAIYLSPDPKPTCIGFAEVEILHNGRNLARGKNVTANFKLSNPIRSFTNLTDGLNLFGEIIPLKDWMHQLARRSALEADLPVFNSILDERYSKQTRVMQLLLWLVVILIFGIIITFLVDRLIRLRQISNIRERFSADLHDELGANVYAISLLSDLAKKASHSPDELNETLDELHALTLRTGDSIQHCANTQRSLIQGSLENDLERSARSILHGIQYTFSLKCPAELNSLKAQTRVDLYLFFKECLVNVSRHAEATQCSIHIWSEAHTIILTVCDNGCGLSDDSIPASLKRRANMLKADLTTSTSTWGGTCFTLKITSRKLRSPFKPSL